MGEYLQRHRNFKMDILELESKVSKIKHSLNGINSRLDTEPEERLFEINKFKEQSFKKRLKN